MPNPVKGEAALKLSGGRSFVLVADHAGLVKGAQAYSGTTKLQRLMQDMQPELDKNGKPKVDEYGDPVKDTVPATAAFLFGLFDAYHPDVTLRDATNMLLSEPDAVATAIGQAVELGFPDAAPSAGGNVGNRRSGKTSGGSGARSAKTTKPSGA